MSKDPVAGNSGTSVVWMEFAPRKEQLALVERPHFPKVRLAEEGFHAPLDLVDGAARVYDPVVQGEAGVDLYGVFLKDYRPANW